MPTKTLTSGTDRNQKPVIGNAKVFISYSRKDGEKFAKDLRRYLEEENIPLWQDRVGMEGGRDWWLQITEALDNVEFLVLVMTPKALESPIIRKEWLYARQKGVCVYPVKGVPDGELNYDSLPRWMRSAHFYDLDHERDKFINDLNTRCIEPRVPFMVDDLPENFVQRPKEFNTLIDQLLNIERGEPLAITTSLRGAGGYGKTALSMALCHDERVQDAYDDGILWVTLGEAPGNLTEKIKNLIEILSGNRPGFTDEVSASTYLSELLADRDILIVIDDAWDIEHIQPFLRGGPRCTRLITTRNSDTLPIKCKQNIVDAMHSNDALSLLSYDLPPSYRDELGKLSERLGHWPLMLKLVNTFLIERTVNGSQPLSTAITYVNKKLSKYGITAFDARNNKIRSQAVEGTLSVSMELLNQEEKDRFVELAIFPEDNFIPIETVQKLWMHAGLDDLDTEDFCEKLFRISLLLHFDPGNRMIKLHDIIRSYLRKMNESQLSSIHARFLDSYGIGHWADLPFSEPYLWEKLAYHLVDGGETNRLSNLLFDFTWLKRKLAISGVNALLSDYNYLPEDREISLVQQALRLSSNQLTHDPDQLFPHLINRLKDFNTPKILKLLDEAIDNHKGPWFYPVTCSLPPPGGPLLQTFGGHNDSVTAVAISQDSKTAVSGSLDHTLKVWDLIGGKATRNLDGHSGTVNSVAISPDGKVTISGSDDHTLKVWDLVSGKVIHTLDSHSGPVYALAISPDGKSAVSGSSDKTLKVWDLVSGKAIHTLDGHSGAVYALAISPDSKSAVSGSSDKTLKVWDLVSEQAIYTLNGHSGPVNSVAITSDGKVTVSGSDDHTLKVWDLVSGKEIYTLDGHSNWINGLAISSDSKVAVSGSKDKTLMLWDLVSGKAIHTLDGHSGPVTAVAISQNGKIAVSGSEDNTLKLWNLVSSRAIHKPNGHSGSVNTLVISSDGKTAVSGSEDHTLKVWDLVSGKEIHNLGGHSGPVSTVAISQDGKTAVSGSEDNTLKVWDLVSGKEIHTLESHSDGVAEVAITPDGKTAVSVSWYLTLKVWDLVSGKEIHTLDGHSRPVCLLAISPDGKTAVFADSWYHILKVRDLVSGKEIHTLDGHSEPVYVAAISSDGRTAVSGSKDNTLKVWDLISGKEIHSLESHSGGVSWVAISPDGKTAVSGSEDNTLKVWDLVSGKAIHTLDGHSGPVTAVAISPDGKTAVSGSEDNTLTLWDLITGKILTSFIGDSYILSLAISSIERIVIAGEQNGNIHFLRFKGVE